MIGEDPYTLGLFDTAGALLGAPHVSEPNLTKGITGLKAKRITIVSAHYHTHRQMCSSFVSV